MAYGLKLSQDSKTPINFRESLQDPGASPSKSVQAFDTHLNRKKKKKIQVSMRDLHQIQDPGWEGKK